MRIWSFAGLGDRNRGETPAGWGGLGRALSRPARLGNYQEAFPEHQVLRNALGAERFDEGKMA